MVLTSYPVSQWAGISYCPKDHTPYTATSIAGQRFAIYYPDGEPADYPDVYGQSPVPKTGWKCLLVLSLSGAGGDGTTSSSSNAAANAADVTSANGFPYQALRRGFAVCYAQMTSGQAANTGVTGLGFIHLPGGTAGHYESTNRPCYLKDSILIIQHLRFNSQFVDFNDADSYKLSGWFALFGVNAAGSLPWICSSPSRAGELGNGGPYEMSTVPNFIVASAFYPAWWLKFKNDEAETAASFPLSEVDISGTESSTKATTLAAAPQRYLRDVSAFSLISDIGEPCHPFMICISNTPPEDLRFGQPFVENVRAYATGIHDGFHMHVMKQSLPRGRVKFFLPMGARWTLSSTQATATEITEEYHDGGLNAAETSYVASTGNVAITGAISDGDTITMGDGLTNVTFEWESGGGVTAGNVAITISADLPTCMNRLLSAITAAGLELSWTDNVPSTTSTNFTSSQGSIAANYTWTKSAANITVTGLSGGSASATSFTDEDPDTGYGIGELVKRCNEQEWHRVDGRMPPMGIRRASQVNTTGRCVVPAADGYERSGIWLTCTSLSCDSDLLYGHTQYAATKRLKPGERTYIAGSGKLWCRAAGGGTQVAKYEAREVDERSK